MSYARKIAYNTIVQVMGRVATTATSLFMVSLLNSGLHAEGWGQYVAVTTYAGLFAVLADMGINTLYLREISRYPEETERITAQYMGFRLVTALIVLSLGPLISLFVPVYSSLMVAIWITSLGQLFLIINQIFVSIFQVQLRMDRAMLTDLINRILSLLGVIVVFHYATGPNKLELVIWAGTLGNFVNMVLSYLLARSYARIRVAFDVKIWPGLLLRVLPMGALAVLGLIHFKADSVILTQLRPTVEVGIYGNAYKIMEILITLPAMFVGGLFPAMNQAILKKDPQFNGFIQKAFDLISFAVVPLILSIVVLAPFIIGVLTRENVGEATGTMRVLALAMIPWFLGTLTGHALLALEQQKRLSLIELAAVILNIVLNLWLIPRFTYYGAAATTVVTEIVVTCSTFWLLFHLTHYRPRLDTLWPTCAAGIFAAAVFVGVARLLPMGYLMDAYFGLSHLTQALVTLGLGALFMFVFLVPLILFRSFPPVLQERLKAFRHNFA